MPDIADAMPPACIGPERLLSRALYRGAYDRTSVERPRHVRLLARQHSLAAIVEHMTLLSPEAIRLYLDSFSFLAEQQTLLDDARRDGSHDSGRDSLFGWIDELPRDWVSTILTSLRSLAARDTSEAQQASS